MALTWLSLLVMSKKLSLERDFTRFLNDPTFPYKVTVCIGGERILCSGVLLAQQSSVLEKKFREDDGVLMFEEMTDVENSHQLLHECINYLLGADLCFRPENIEMIMKFASWYRVSDMLEKSIKWFENYLNTEKSVKIAMDYLKFSNCLDAIGSISLKSAIRNFIRSNRDIMRMEIVEHLDISLSGFDIALVVAEVSDNCGIILKQWASLSDANKEFLVSNHALFDFMKIFRNADEFSSFVSFISSGTSSVESMKSLLDIQKNYFSFQKSKEGRDCMPSTGTSNISGHIAIATAPNTSNFYFTQTNTLSVIINNVPNSATEARLEGLFKSVGRIDSIERNKSEKSGIVTFQDSASVSRLLNSKCNYAMDGHQLLITPYDTSTGLDNESVSACVFVGNLPKSASKSELIRLFKFAGKISDIDWNHKLSSAILRFESTTSAKTLLNSGRRFMLDSHELEIDECEEYSDDEEDPIEVYVGNVPDSATKADLKRLFCGFGKILEITIKMNRPKTYRFAFITFEENDSAIALIKSGQSRQCKLQGNVLKIAKKHSN